MPWVLSRRPGIRVETLQSEYGVHDHAQVPHLKITAINGGPSPVQVIQWTLEDQPLWHMRAATSTWGNRLDRWGLPGPWRRSGLVAFFTSVPAESGLPRNVLPLVLPPNDHADWYMPIASERDFIANRANGNPDHLRARIHLADGRSAVSSWFELRDA